MDEEILEALFFVGVPVFNMKNETTPGDPRSYVFYALASKHESPFFQML